MPLNPPSRFDLRLNSRTRRLLRCCLPLMVTLGMFVALNPALSDDSFTEDAAAAVAAAVKQNKDILFLYTGSDWCPPCQKLEKEVLSEEEFLREVSKHYILVKFDFLKQTEQDAEIARQNEEWAQKFGVDSFPTLVLTDNQLKPFAFAGYEEGGFQNYLDLLENARQLRVKRDESIAAAKLKTGEERAKLLDQSISEIREEIVRVYYSDVIDEIVELDKNNDFGLRAKWNAAADAEMRKVVITDILMISRIQKPQLAIRFIEEVMAEFDFTNEEQLKILQIKLSIVRQLKDNAQTDAVLDEMISLDGVEGSTRQRLIVKKIFLMVGGQRGEEAMKQLDSAISTGGDAVYLHLAKGEILSAQKEYAAAIVAFDQALKTARRQPDVMIEVVSAKADALYELQNAEEALRSLDNFADDTQMPSDLRAEALLHKAMIMRDMKRTRQARLAENRAIQITESAQERAQMQKIVERIRKSQGN